MRTRFCAVVIFASGCLCFSQGTAPVPAQPGLYYQAPEGLTRMDGQVVSFGRTGSVLVSSVTFGIKSRKMNVQLIGEHALNKVASNPVFYYRVASVNEAAGGAAGDLILVNMIVKGGRRQFEVAAAGTGRASLGVSIRSQVQLYTKQVEESAWRLSPAKALPRGEYGLYLYRGYNLPAYIYDFTVE